MTDYLGSVRAVVDETSGEFYKVSDSFSNNNPVNFVDLDGREIHVASEYQEQFIDDLKEIFGDKVESFSFDGEKLTLNVTKKEFKKGLNRDQKALFKGLEKALSDRTETSVIYENSVNIKENGKVQNIDVIRDYGGGAYIKDKGIIVVAPDIGTVTVWPDDFSSPVEVAQNTTSGLFHEIGERNESDETLRGNVIIYENYARQILGLPKRPYDWTHRNPQPIYPIN